MGGVGILLVFAALVGLWEEGLVAGSALLLIAYVSALAVAHHALDPAAPIFGAGLLALVDLGSWSLELRDSRETPPLHHLRTLAALTLGGLATSVAVLAAGELGTGGGIALWFLGAAAAAALFTMIRPHANSHGRASDQSIGGSNTSRPSSSQPE
jgi:hypothetical protein